MKYIFLYIWFFIFGSAMGSFYNVLSDRLPEGRSVISSRSECTFCHTTLKWYDLVPVFSFIFLGGKCRYCKQKLSFWYPLSEIFNGAVFVFAAVLFVKSGSVTDLIFFLVFWSLLYITGVTDFKSGVMFDLISGLIAITGLIHGILEKRSFSDFAFGVLCGAAFFGLIYAVTRFIFKKEGLGPGDVILLTAFGFIFNWPQIIIIVFMTAYVSIVFIVINAIKNKGIHRQMEIPMGPALCISAFIMSFAGGSVTDYLMNLLGF